MQYFPLFFVILWLTKWIMKSKVVGFKYIIFIASFALISLESLAQLDAPERNWSSSTEYIASNQQDSIFVFFSTPSSPSVGKLKATFSDGSLSTFNWFRYNSSPSISPQNRFQPLTTIANVAESELVGLSPGGYRVEVVRTADDSTEVYTAWVFVDHVVISEIFVDNNCSFLFLEAVTVPDRYTIFYELFTYYDLSTSNHLINNKLGVNYLTNISWLTSNTNITIPSGSSLSKTITNPAPLYNASYTIRLNNPFGRLLTLQTPILEARATRAVFDLYINTSTDAIPIWENGGENPEGEALLEVKLESKSINADSIFWNIINDERLFRRGGDSIIWRYKAYMGSTIEEAFPPKQLMVPGYFTFEHISLKTSSGCRDTIYKIVQVDTSFIKAEAIPNVFSPNGDGQNDLFLIKDSDTNLKSIKQFSIFIYSRWGKLMYTYNGDPRGWEGWNGQLQGTGSDVPEGVYYYVIEAVGWDGRKFRGGVYKGFLHLFRGN